MGAECPICGKHGAFVLAITASGEPATKNDEIIAKKLECGHVLGNTEYMAYREKLHAIEADGANQKRMIDDDIRTRKTALWSAVINKKTEA